MSQCPVAHPPESSSVGASPTGGHAAASTPSARAMAYFDSLEPVSVEFMLGKWRGEGLPTDHPMDGMLENFNWYGKEFVSADHVHPLVFRRQNGELVKLNPQWMPMKYARNSAFSRQAWFRKLFDLGTRVMQTDASKARLRMTEYRGKSSATMIYDDLPINDVFRKIDEDNVLGVMDLKGMKQPFFFKLSRVR